MKKKNSVNVMDVKKRIAFIMKEREIALKRPELKAAKDEFIEKFVLAETLYKELLRSYNRAKHKKVADNDLKLHMSQIPRVLEYWGYSISKEKYLEPLFSGDKDKFGKRGHRSAKMLRNGITYELNVQDMEEVLKRREYLLGLLDHFIDTVSERSERPHRRHHNVCLKMVA